MKKQTLRIRLRMLYRDCDIIFPAFGIGTCCYCKEETLEYTYTTQLGKARVWQKACRYAKAYWASHPQYKGYDLDIVDSDDNPVWQ